MENVRELKKQFTELLADWRKRAHDLNERLGRMEKVIDRAHPDWSNGPGVTGVYYSGSDGGSYDCGGASGGGGDGGGC